MMRISLAFQMYALVLDALRSACCANGMTEFVPVGKIPTYAHHPHMHSVIENDDVTIILPYQLSLHNRLAVHFLDRPSFCVGPCYRNDENTPFHSRVFTQFAFESFGSDLDDLELLVRSLMGAVINAVKSDPIKIETVNVLKSKFDNNDEINKRADNLNIGIIVKNKPKGIPPYLNKLISTENELALELVLPVVGETLDGGVRDPIILHQTYGVFPDKQTIGASFGLERLVAFLLAVDNLKDVDIS